MIQQSRVIPFRRKPSAMDRINSVLNALCIGINIVCVAISLFIIGGVSFLLLGPI